MVKKKKEASIVRSSAAEYLTFVAASGQGGVETVYADENVWLTQKMMATLYDVDVRTINYHLKKVFEDNELQQDSVIRKFRITAADGKGYDTKHYNLAELMAQNKIPMTIQDWEIRLNRFIEMTDREVLQDAGKVTAEIAKTHAESEFEKYRIVQDRLFESDFDLVVKQLEAGHSARDGGKPKQERKKKGENE
ncbi:RhuM family protein [Nitrosomonas sp.]|uniref:RhuM family protein n=1 Tax=Nitrosomonas sp. TaxID=42353 RepID=UPI0027300E3E|nr:RhuM family protein [Nitrosomonas sp.]MDP1787748.1 RhuM family protein [Nitrosomonas sp.]